MQLSKRSSNITQSEIRAMSLACRKANGINLSQGVCDTETPSPVLESARQAISGGHNSYTRHDGIDPLRTAIAEKELRDKGINVDPNSEIVVSSGATGALYSAVMALLNPGDEVIVFEPFYGYHISTLQSADITINYIRLTAPEWEFTDEQLAEVVTSKTRAILINTPGNPCGKVFTRDELLRIGRFAEQHDLIIFSDEIYEYFVYEGEHISPISIPELRPRTVVVGGFSKTFSITGWRVGYTIAPAHVTDAIGHLSDLIYVCAPAPLQVGVAAGLNSLSEDHYLELRDDHLKKRDMICASLAKAGLNPTIPKGAYYLLADVSKVPGKTSREKALNLLEMTGIAGVPGSAFFHDTSGDNLIRFCFAKELSIIKECCKRFENLVL